ncbi:MAG: hypothetical protein A2Z72_04615 [Omnitrophica bacterium RBG_13_46_9]|nr:MAG: hypothetical protein A2Z72_04615 [Omnitrophica bacterium RBG_13_46_9]
MKILAPINNPKEAEDIIRAGADEIYCGVLPADWRGKYTNVASSNRREWKAANLESFYGLKKIVDTAHAEKVPVYLALNALYTEEQYQQVFDQIEQSKNIGVDALIVADLGLLLNLKNRKTGLDIHISTGGTTFNSETAKFYEELGASRIILPRHLRIREMEKIVRSCPSLKFEVFILNSGCKNIDGFCTFQHGVNEILHPRMWNLPKRLNFDRYFLNVVRRMPSKLAVRIKSDVFGIDSACLLNYKITMDSDPADLDKEKKQHILRNISSGFTLLSGIDTCGACRLAELKDAGVYGVKIVGRNYSTSKKISDIIFLRTVLRHMENNAPGKKEFYKYVKNVFRRTYGLDCKSLCYYPDGM